MWRTHPRKRIMLAPRPLCGSSKKAETSIFEHMSNVSLPPNRSWFSEFDFGPFKYLGLKDSAGCWLALFCGIWTFAVLLLGDLLGANAMGMQLRVDAPLSSGETATAIVSMTHGYLATVTAGPYYLLVGPLLLLLTHKFLRMAGEGFARCHVKGMLDSHRWHSDVYRKNKRFRWIWYFAIPVSIVLCLIFQLSSLERSSAGCPTRRPNGTDGYWELGYIQSPNHGRWAAGFNKMPGEKKILALDEQSRFPPLGDALFKELERANQVKDPWVVKSVEYTKGEATGFALREAFGSAGSKIRISAKAVYAPAMLYPRGLWPGAYFRDLQETRNLPPEREGERAVYLRWFRFFAVLAQLQIAFFFCFSAWLVAKICVYFHTIYQMVPISGVRQRTRDFCPMREIPEGVMASEIFFLHITF